MTLVVGCNPHAWLHPFALRAFCYSAAGLEISHEASQKLNYQPPDDAANLLVLACPVRYPMEIPILAEFGPARFAKGERPKALHVDLQTHWRVRIFNQVRFFYELPARRDPPCRARARPSGIAFQPLCLAHPTGSTR